MIIALLTEAGRGVGVEPLVGVALRQTLHPVVVTDLREAVKERARDAVRVRGLAENVKQI